MSVYSNKCLRCKHQFDNIFDATSHCYHCGLFQHSYKEYERREDAMVEIYFDIRYCGVFGYWVEQFIDKHLSFIKKEHMHHYVDVNAVKVIIDPLNIIMIFKKNDGRNITGYRPDYFFTDSLWSEVAKYLRETNAGEFEKLEDVEKFIKTRYELYLETKKEDKKMDTFAMYDNQTVKEDKNNDYDWCKPDTKTVKEYNDCVKPDNVNHPAHYEREGAIECIDEMLMIFGPRETMVFCKLNAWKYRYRAADKNGKEDIAKSDWYMRKYKEIKKKFNL